MGNSLSKFCQILSYPLRLYEWKKTKKVYDELFTDEFDANLEEDRKRFVAEKIELAPEYRF
tara:strand:- start:296 stop:478 length:183 start_codon:yes stop_codon:yes gene_type:complete